jgi:cell fate regulator YaaT (PSP1 superfamily)
MAEPSMNPSSELADDTAKPWQMSVEEAREQAKARFRDRLANGEQVGACSCSSEEEQPAGNGENSRVVGVRFRDSGRVYFFESGGADLDVGTWVVCTTSRGEEAARVVVAPKQVLMSQLDGDLKPIDRVLSEGDVEIIDQRRKDAAKIVRRGAEISRAYDFGIKVVAAEYSLDGRRARVSYGASDHSFVQDLGGLLEDELGIQVEMQHVGPRDEARLIGGLGKCGRTLCCSSWLPVYPDVSMGMAKNQDLSLNPTKVSGLCGRLLCCLSYENEQYRKAKQILPRLGQRIRTPEGEGMVVSLQVLKEMVTVRYTNPHREVTYPAADLLSPGKRPETPRAAAPNPEEVEPAGVAERSPVPSEERGDDQPRRRRRRRRRSGGDGQSTGPNE